MHKVLLGGVSSWALAVLAATAIVDAEPQRAAAAELASAPSAQQPAPQQPAQGPRAQGVKLTVERLGGSDGAKHTQRTRLLSLAVERGETVTPFVPPGLFRSTLTTTLQLPARDRCRFRIDGRGSAKLTINGVTVLDGALRAGKPLETAQPVRLDKGDNQLVVTFESAATGDGQFRLFWAGTDFGFEPIAPERLSYASDDPEVRAGEHLRTGMHLFAERRCARCHEPEVRRVGESAFAELDGSGPDLRQAGGRLQRDWIAAWLDDPRQFRPDATMPEFALTAQECNDLAEFLASLGAPAPGPVFAGNAAELGAARFRQLGCVACHVEPGAAAGQQPEGRISLAHVPHKWHPRALIDYLHDPRRAHPHVRMPDLKVSLDDATLLAAWLLSVAPAASLEQRSGDAASGKRLAQKHGCALCHTLDVPLADRPWPRLRNLDPERGCLGEKPAERGAPDHGFTPEQRTAVRAFLPFGEEVPFRRAPLDFAQRHVESDRCTACHALDNRPSTWARWTEVQNAQAPLPKEHDPIAQGVPALTWVGSKLQPSWIERFVRGEEKSPRPWLTARMPAFGLHGGPIAQGLVREHGYGPQDEPARPPDAALALHGERLMAQGTGFGCVQCHALGDKPAVQVFEREGIELLTARSRLRHEYYTRWLADPPRVDPDARMPKWSDNKGKTAIADVLDGDAAKQFEAIWQHLGGRTAGRK